MIPIGYALMSLSFVVLLVAARLGPIVSPFWLIGSIILSTLSELAVSIGGLSRSQSHATALHAPSYVVLVCDCRARWHYCGPGR